MLSLIFRAFSGAASVVIIINFDLHECPRLQTCSIFAASSFSDVCELLLHSTAEAGITGRGAASSSSSSPLSSSSLHSFLFFSLLLSSNFHGAHGGRGGGAWAPLAPTLNPPLLPAVWVTVKKIHGSWSCSGEKTSVSCEGVSWPCSGKKNILSSSLMFVSYFFIHTLLHVACDDDLTLCSLYYFFTARIFVQWLICELFLINSSCSDSFFRCQSASSSMQSLSGDPS